MHIGGIGIQRGRIETRYAVVVACFAACDGVDFTVARGFLASELGEVARAASDAKDVVTLSSLVAAKEARDFRAMERAIVEFKCAER